MLVLDPKRVRSRLALMEWTQTQLAFALDISPWFMSRVMQGHAVLDEGAVEQVARVLQCNVADIADRYVKVGG